METSNPNKKDYWPDEQTAPVSNGALIMSPDIKELATALAKAQGQIKGALKDAENPFFKSKYADLASVWDACRNPLSQNGLAVVQTINGEKNTVLITTMLIHSSGQWIKDTLPMTPTKTDPQGVGSAITYGRRYALSAMVGVAPAEDDGNAASGKDKTQPVKIPNDVRTKVYEQTKQCLETADEPGLNEIWNEFNADEQVALWGMFNSQERAAIKRIKAGK